MPELEQVQGHVHAGQPAGPTARPPSQVKRDARLVAGPLGQRHANDAAADPASPASPFVPPPASWIRTRAHWVGPKLVDEVEFTEWTDDGRLRHPYFQGLRLNKAPKEVVREAPVARRSNAT